MGWKTKQNCQVLLLFTSLVDETSKDCLQSPSHLRHLIVFLVILKKGEWHDLGLAGSFLMLWFEWKISISCFSGDIKSVVGICETRVCIKEKKKVVGTHGVNSISLEHQLHQHKLLTTIREQFIDSITLTMGIFFFLFKTVVIGLFLRNPFCLFISHFKFF